MSLSAGLLVYLGEILGLLQVGSLLSQLQGDVLQLALHLLQSGDEILLHVSGLLDLSLPRLDLTQSQRGDRKCGTGSTDSSLNRESGG